MYLGTRESRDTQKGGGGYMCLNPGIYTWVLGNPKIFRQGGGGGTGASILGCIYLGTRESQDTQTKGRINILGSAWDVLGTLVLYYITWDSIVYKYKNHFMK